MSEQWLEQPGSQGGVLMKQEGFGLPQRLDVGGLPVCAEGLYVEIVYFQASAQLCTERRNKVFKECGHKNILMWGALSWLF